MQHKAAGRKVLYQAERKGRQEKTRKQTLEGHSEGRRGLVLGR
jgi:hypothetical protein